MPVDYGGRVPACLVCEIRGWFFPQLHPVGIFDSVQRARDYIAAQPNDGKQYWYVAQGQDGLMRDATSVKKWRGLTG